MACRIREQIEAQVNVMGERLTANGQVDDAPERLRHQAGVDRRRDAETQGRDRSVVRHRGARRNRPPEETRSCAWRFPDRSSSFTAAGTDLATVDVSGVRRRVNIGLLEGQDVRGRRLGADPRRVRDEQDRRGAGARADADARRCSARTRPRSKSSTAFSTEGQETRHEIRRRIPRPAPDHARRPTRSGGWRNRTGTTA